MTETEVQISNLKEQIAIHDDQLKDMEEQGIPDSGQYNAIRSERDTAAKRLEAIEAEVKAGIEAQVQLFSMFDNIDVGDGTIVRLRDLAENEKAYQLLSTFFQGYVGDQAQKHAAIVSSYESQNDKLLEDLRELESIRKRNADLDNKCADLEAKRDAAADELFQAQEEVKRLSADNESLRKQLEATNKPVQTNVKANLAELAQQWKATRPAIYNKRWKNENLKTEYLAILAETGEEITIPWMEVEKYREVSPEEGETFRREVEQAIPADVVPDSPLVEYPTVPDFPFQSEEGTADGLAETNTPVEMAGETVTRSEFEALKAEVERVKRFIGIKVA